MRASIIVNIIVECDCYHRPTYIDMHACTYKQYGQCIDTERKLVSERSVYAHRHPVTALPPPRGLYAAFATNETRIRLATTNVRVSGPHLRQQQQQQERRRRPERDRVRATDEDTNNGFWVPAAVGGRAPNDRNGFSGTARTRGTIGQGR